jgi:hypothetical protein
MDSIKWWARNGEVVRQAIELGEIAHIETASEELTPLRKTTLMTTTWIWYLWIRYGG